MPASNSRFQVVDTPRLAPAQCLITKKTSDGPYVLLAKNVFHRGAVYLKASVIVELYNELVKAGAIQTVVTTPVQPADDYNSTVEKHMEGLNAVISGYFDGLRADGISTDTSPLDVSENSSGQPEALDELAIMQGLGDLRISTDATFS